MRKGPESLHNRTGVYSILNMETGDFYVGSAARSFLGRKCSHISRLRKGIHHSPHLQNAWNKYGEDRFYFSILQETEPKDCIVSEQFWIDLLEPIYNVSKVAGSPLGTKHSEESKKRRSEFTKGRKHTPEAKEKMRIAVTGRKHSDETKSKISAYVTANPPRPFLGKKHTEEALAKMRIGFKGGSHTEEWKKANSERHKGSKRSPEVREIMRQHSIDKWKPGGACYEANRIRQLIKAGFEPEYYI